MAAQPKQNRHTSKRTPDRNPRLATAGMLDLLSQGVGTLDRLLDDHANDLDRLSRKDRAFFNALVFGVLRQRGRLDYIISHFSKTPLKRINPTVLNILRIGLFQILFMDRVPVSAAVNTSVDMAKKTAPKWTVGFVNGLLRNAARHHDSVPFPSSVETPAEHIAADQSLPLWLAKRWLSRFGFKQTQKLATAINTPPPITIRCNTIKTRRPDLINILKNQVQSIHATRVSQNGISFSSPVLPIFQMDSFRSGDFQVQDEAAQLVTELLGPKPGESILDACAGMGGKTGHIAQKMCNKGNILAIDNSKARLKKLKNEMVRLGIDGVRALAVDLRKQPITLPDAMFDRILVDAPCSGLGVLRRNPDTRWSVMEPGLSKNARRQGRILDNLARFLKPNGTMVYAVCSFEPEENEQVINGFLKNNANFAIKLELEDISNTIQEILREDGFYRTFPHVHDMDGFFAAVLTKRR